MKKVSYLLAAVAVLALAGCAKEIEKQGAENAGDAVSLRVSVEEPESRVSIDNAAAFSFQSGDIISVITSEGTPVDFTTVAGGTSVDFTGTLPTGESVGDYALYPASSNHMVDGDEVLFTLEEELTWNTDESFMPMLAKIDNGTASFKAVGGVLKLIVYNIPAAADYLYFSSNNQQISGEFEIADASVASPVIATGVASGSNDGLIIDFSADYSTNKVFYIPLPTGTINGFSIAFWDDNMDDISGATKTTSATLNVTRNKIIIAPALNMAPATNVTLWSEDFSQYVANDVPDGDEGVGYGNVDVTYSVGNGGGTTKIYTEALAGGTSPELLVAKKDNNTSNYGTFTASGIPTAGASSAVLTFKTNKTGSVTLSSSTTGITIGTKSTNGSTVTYPITIGTGVSTFSLTLANTGGQNARIDDIVLEATVGTAPATPSIVTQNGTTATISAGSQRASINGIQLANPLDNLGIAVTTDVDWLTLAFTEGSFSTGAKLTATATSYNHNETARSATVTLKATGASSRTLTFTQNPSLVPNPTTLTATPGDKTFSVSWTGDSKAGSYVAYYSSTDLSSGNPATSGTAMTVTKEGNTYTAVPEETLVNRTTYYVYVKVGSVDENYPAYGISAGWATTTAVPMGEVAVQTVNAPYSQMFKANGQGLFVQDIIDDDGTGEDIWTYSSSYGMVASGNINGTNHETEAWLLSPKIVIGASLTNPYVSFKHVGNYFNTPADMKADVPIFIREVGGSWVQLNVDYPAGNSWSPWTTVDYSLMNYIGKTVQFGWDYTSTSSRCGKYQLDEFKVYENEETTYTITWNANNNSQGVNNYTTTWSVTADGLTLSMTNWNNNNNGWDYVKAGSKKAASVATIITSTAIPEAIKTVKITIDALTANKINSIKLYSSANGTSWTDEGSFNKATGVQSVVISTPSASKYYKLEFDCAKGSDNGLITVSKLVFTTE